ncbi:unnamed protein product [Diatraea saccharalis]|uniref:Titin-like n=1 Tax=Diatraea saccharalis TaxID=40085 RepID=A0A9N9QX39_9NEOP|nr:unnamed protein product [Diatraea saccharalis]
MILLGAMLFLLGTVSANPSLPTEMIMHEHKHGTSDKVNVLSSSSLSALIGNYLQEGTNVFFKPQLSQMQPVVENDDCKMSHPLITPVAVNEPIRVVEKEISAPFGTNIEHITEMKPAAYVNIPKPAAPLIVEDIKPFIIPEPPKRRIPELEINEPLNGVMEIEEENFTPVLPTKPQNIPLLYKEELPMKSFFMGVEDQREMEVPVMLPPGPVIPPMVPKSPVSVENTRLPYKHHPTAPIFVKLEEPKEVKIPVVIPPAPVLPPFEFSQLPVQVEEAPLYSKLPSPVIVKEPALVERHTQHLVHDVKIPMYYEQNGFYGVPYSIHNFDSNKYCDDDIVVEQMLPEMRHDMIYQKPVPYLFPPY